MDSAKRILQWLGGTHNHGIRFTQGCAFAASIFSWVDRPDNVTSTTTYTDENWGPQDASTPINGQIITKDENVDHFLVTLSRVWGVLLYGIACRNPNPPTASVKLKFFPWMKAANPLSKFATFSQTLVFLRLSSLIHYLLITVVQSTGVPVVIFPNASVTSTFVKLLLFVMMLRLMISLLLASPVNATVLIFLQKRFPATNFFNLLHSNLLVLVGTSLGIQGGVSHGIPVPSMPTSHPFIITYRC